MRTDLDLHRAIEFALRNRVAKALRGFPLARVHGVRDLGCSIPEFMRYIEARWVDGMTWANHGVYGWHLDHIRPLASVDLNDYAEALKAVRFTNYQPLWSSLNRRKGVRFVAPAPTTTMRLPTDDEIDAAALAATRRTR